MGIVSIVVPFGGYVILGGSWDLTSTVISTLLGVTSSCKYSYLIYNPIVTKSHEPLSRILNVDLVKPRTGTMETIKQDGG